MIYKRIALWITSFLSIALMTFSMSVNAGIQSEMNKTFNSMSNYTPPGVHETQRRGVLSGGSLYVRNPVVNTSIVSFLPPSISADCGGMDFFGGSFSFINAQEFVKLLRSVASNAAGYAFKLALQVGCDFCSQIISEMQAIVQEINQMLGDSCQLAQGIVSGSIFQQGDAAIGRIGERISNMGTAIKGVFTDPAQAFFGKNKTKGIDEQEKLPEEQKERIVGNVVFEVAKKNNLKSLFGGGISGDAVEYGEIMSITGTIIVDTVQDAEGGNKANPYQKLGKTLTMEDLIYGTTGSDGNARKVLVYHCDDSTKCLHPTKSNFTFEGLYAKAKKVLRGSGGAGVMDKYRRMSGNAFSKEEANMMANIGAVAGTMIRNIAIVSQEGTDPNNSINELAFMAAMEWARNYTENIFALVQAQLHTSKSEFKGAAMETISEMRTQWYEEYDKLASANPTQKDLLNKYNEMLKMVRTPSLAAARTSQGSSVLGQ